MTKPADLRIDISSLPALFTRLRKSSPTLSVEVKPSAYDGKVVLYHEDEMVRTMLRRLIIAL
ncbi:hypothetical protein Kaagvere_00005 [Pseudomonas phage vB_PpuP-Kaagvere]